MPILELLEDLVPQKNLAGLEIVLVPQDFAEIASTNVEEAGAPILGNLLAPRLQDPDKISLQEPLQGPPPQGQVTLIVKVEFPDIMHLKLKVGTFP